MLPPDEDATVARERGLTCTVCRKAKRGAPWVTVAEVKELRDAVAQAQGVGDYEVAVFVETDAGGFLYWTSKHPDVFNSDVVQQPGAP